MRSSELKASVNNALLGLLIASIQSARSSILFKCRHCLRLPDGVIVKCKLIEQGDHFSFCPTDKDSSRGGSRSGGRKDKNASTAIERAFVMFCSVYLIRIGR